MPYISNKRPKPKPPQNNVMTISKALKAVNDNMDWTVLFIALLATNGLAGNGVSPLSRLVTNIFLSISQRFLFLIIKSNLFTNKYGITTFHKETILTVVFPKSIGICNNSFLWLYTNFTTSM